MLEYTSCRIPKISRVVVLLILFSVIQQVSHVNGSECSVVDKLSGLQISKQLSKVINTQSLSQHKTQQQSQVAKIRRLITEQSDKRVAVQLKSGETVEGNVVAYKDDFFTLQMIKNGQITYRDTPYAVIKKLKEIHESKQDKKARAQIVELLSKKVSIKLKSGESLDGWVAGIKGDFFSLRLINNGQTIFQQVPYSSVKAINGIIEIDPDEKIRTQITEWASKQISIKLKSGGSLEGWVAEIKKNSFSLGMTNKYQTSYRELPYGLVKDIKVIDKKSTEPSKKDLTQTTLNMLARAQSQPIYLNQNLVVYPEQLIGWNSFPIPNIPSDIRGQLAKLISNSPFPRTPDMYIGADFLQHLKTALSGLKVLIHVISTDPTPGSAGTPISINYDVINFTGKTMTVRMTGIVTSLDGKRSINLRAPCTDETCSNAPTYVFEQVPPESTLKGHMTLPSSPKGVYEISLFASELPTILRLGQPLQAPLTAGFFNTLASVKGSPLEISGDCPSTSPDYINIDSFAGPATQPPVGKEVTLNWAISGGRNIPLNYHLKLYRSSSCSKNSTMEELPLHFSAAGKPATDSIRVTPCDRGELYTLEVTSPNGNCSQQKFVQVVPHVLPPMIVSFTAEPNNGNIPPGSSATLGWNILNCYKACTITLEGHGGLAGYYTILYPTNVSPSGSYTVTPRDYSYSKWTLKASNLLGSDRKDQEVTLTSTAPPTTGFSRITAYNCNTEKHQISVYLWDYKTGAWEKKGVLLAQFDASGYCPSGGSAPLTIPLEDGHIYRIVATDPNNLSCDGRDDPEIVNCQRYTLTVYGDSKGPSVPITIP